jgi:hypothetical protein
LKLAMKESMFSASSSFGGGQLSKSIPIPPISSRSPETANGRRTCTKEFACGRLNNDANLRHRNHPSHSSNPFLW